MANHFRDLSKNVKKSFGRVSKTKHRKIQAAPIDPCRNVPEGMVLFTDGSILIGTPDLDTISRGKRQTLTNLLTYKQNNKIIIYGNGARLAGDLIIDELLCDECIEEVSIDYGFNILELGKHHSLRVQISEMKNRGGEHKYYRLFNFNNFSNSDKVIRHIVSEYNIGIVVCFLNVNEDPSKIVNEVLEAEHIEVLKCLSLESYNIPIIGIIEAFDLPDGLTNFADVVVHVNYCHEEDDRILVICEKPGKKLFEPFYMYQDLVFVYEKDSLNPESMNALGKRIIQP